MHYEHCKEKIDLKDISEDVHTNSPLLRVTEPKSNQLLEDKLWGAPFSGSLRPCMKPSSIYKATPAWEQYITVRSNGGLNRMRTGIADMVAVARIMNGTLVIPQLDKRSFWQDSSTFADVFDELHFIISLQQDVRIVTQLPKELEPVPRARKHFTLWSGVSYYEEMTQLWKDYQAKTKMSGSLSCPPLFSFYRKPGKAQKLVERLKSRAQRYIALHLRYEKDMLAFTGCTYGLTDSESEELKTMRQSTNHWKIKNINSTEQRIGGFCPLTPKEIGMVLEALGYPSSTLIYIAAGEIYGGDSHLSEFTSLFRNIVFKEMLATEEELRPFFSYASQTAALDYIVSVE